MSWSARPATQQEQVGQLILAGALVTMLPQLPLGNFLLYPFTILTTWFHEMGHGLTAMLLGWDFERLVLLPDGSGFAESYSPADTGGVSRALVSAGGPLGPSLVGALLIATTRYHRLWRPALYALAGLIAISTLIWVRSVVGVVVLPLVAVAMVAIGLRAKDWLVRFSVQLLGMLGALSMLRDWHYLFSHSAVIGGRPMLSDTGAMEEALFLPYWLWAGLIVLISGAMVGTALKYALAEDGSVRRLSRR